MSFGIVLRFIWLFFFLYSIANAESKIEYPHKIQRPIERFRKEIDNIKTVEDIMVFQRKNHFYTFDKGHPYSDDIKSPYRLYKERTGDCEDFAIQAVYLARLNGWLGTVMAFRGQSFAHAFALIYDGNQVYAICNITLGLKRFKNNSMFIVEVPVNDTNAVEAGLMIQLFYTMLLDESLDFFEYIKGENISESEVVVE